MADYILLMQMDIPTELEDDFNHFYNTQHVRYTIGDAGHERRCI